MNLIFYSRTLSLGLATQKSTIAISSRRNNAHLDFPKVKRLSPKTYAAFFGLANNLQANSGGKFDVKLMNG